MGRNCIDFDDSHLRRHIIDDVEFERRQELVDFFGGKGYFNELILEQLAYVFFAKSNQERYDEIFRQMSSVIALKQYSGTRLYIRPINGKDIPQSNFATELFIKGVKEHVLGILGRGQSANYHFMKEYVNSCNCVNNSVVDQRKKPSLGYVGACLVERYGPDFEYYDNIPRERFEEAVREIYEELCPICKTNGVWRGRDLFVVGPYDMCLYELCARVFDGMVDGHDKLKDIHAKIEALCKLSASNSPLYRMLEDYNRRISYNYWTSGKVVKFKRLPKPGEAEKRQLERLEKGLRPDYANSVAKNIRHLSYQYIYYVLSWKVIAPGGYVPHPMAALIYDLYRIITNDPEPRKAETAKEKHAIVSRSFKIDPSTGLYIKGL